MEAKIFAVLFIELASMAAHGMQLETKASLSVFRKDSPRTYLIRHVDIYTGNIILTTSDGEGDMVLKVNIGSQKSFAIPVNHSSLAYESYVVSADNGKQKANLIIKGNSNPLFEERSTNGQVRSLEIIESSGNSLTPPS